jgi:hypothetical protein
MKSRHVTVIHPALTAAPVTLLLLASLLLLSACDSPQQLVAERDGLALEGSSPASFPEARAGTPADQCFNVQYRGESSLGFQSLTWADGELYQGLGAFGDVAFAGYEGEVTSVVVDAEPRGNGNGALHVSTMYHVFDRGDDGTFYTEDTAVCGPTIPCRVNSRMSIVGGTGDFEGATGKLHNHGWLSMATFTLDLHIHGRICLNE